MKLPGVIRGLHIGTFVALGFANDVAITKILMGNFFGKHHIVYNQFFAQKTQANMFD